MSRWGTSQRLSPDGAKLVFAANEGMVIANGDGTNRQVLANSAWGVQLSPDGNQVGYYDFASRNLVVMDLATRNKRHLLEVQIASRYGSFYWGGDWSPDGTEFACVGLNKQTGKKDLFVVSILVSKRGFDVLSSADIRDYEVAWHPSGKQLMYSKQSLPWNKNRMFLVDRLAPHMERPFPGQPVEYSCSSADWSPDGKQIVFACDAPQEYLPD